MSALLDQVSGVEAFLRQNEEKELLRLSTAGSVDDGKSTLIGRLLYDSKGVSEDQLASVRKATVNQTAGTLDFALLTDGLRAEREQGITIDVAYRYFSTPKRKFIIADTPGHEQYTRNMATGASTADLAIILVDARNGVLPQSRRHAFIASLLGIPHVIVAVNKMDLVDWSEEVYRGIVAEFQDFAGRLGLRDLVYIPISALLGDNVVERSANTPWYDGVSLLEHLEDVPLSGDHKPAELRFPVQYVIRPNLDFRGFAGQLTSGRLRQGDDIVVLPSGHTSRVKSIVTYDGDLQEALPPMSVTVCLEDEVDVSRGDMLVHPDSVPHVSRRFHAHLVWMNQKPLEGGREYILKHTTRQVRARVITIRYRADVNTLQHQPAERLDLNEIGFATLQTSLPLYFDSYRRNRATGAFILIDPISNETVGAGMIEEAADAGEHEGLVTQAERQARMGHRPAAIWAPNEDLARRLERKLFDEGCIVAVVRPEHVPALLAAGLIAIAFGGPKPQGEWLEATQDLELVFSQLEERGLATFAGRFSGGSGI